MSSVQLPIPFRSQWDADAAAYQTDCGPACLAMILNGAGVAISTDEVYDYIGEKEFHEFTNFVELISAAEQNGYAMNYHRYDTLETALHWLKAFLDQGRPVLALVKYQPWRDITGNQFSWGHFVVVVGYDEEHVYVHDPLFGLWQPRSQGERFTFQTTQFLAGWGGFDDPEENPNWACAVGARIVTNGQPSPEDDTGGREPMDTEEEELTAEVRRRIKGLAGYIWAEPPDFENHAEVRFWQDHLGDWGAERLLHTVSSGETLAQLAARYYQEQWRWPAIRLYNELPGEWVYVGQRLGIPLPGQDRAHLNPELPANSASFGIEQPDYNPTLAAIDYDKLGSNTVGMGYLTEDE